MSLYIQNDIILFIILYTDKVTHKLKHQMTYTMTQIAYMLVKTCVCVAYIGHHVEQTVIFQEIYNLIVFYRKNIEFIRIDLTYDDKFKKVA